MSPLDRFNIHKLFIALSIGLTLIGLSGFGSNGLNGAFRGLGAVFFVLFYICNLLKNEKTDEELAALKNVEVFDRHQSSLSVGPVSWKKAPSPTERYSV